MAKRKEEAIRRDSMDFRDLIYQPALLSLPEQRLPNWQWLQVLDQEQEGACTGFGLAAVINYLLRERGKKEQVSPRMLFEMAKRFDQWPGEKYDFSSTRGALKGWYKNGVCKAPLWPYKTDKPGTLSEAAKLDALQRPLGAYYRVLTRVSDVHAALNEVGVLYASAGVHDGWDEPKKGVIVPEKANGGGHAFAIIGYNADGFLIQNSWGHGWGGYKCDGAKHDGVALWTYEDFEQNIWDIWAARLALPQTWRSQERSRYTASNAGIRVSDSGPAAHAIDHHYIHIDDGQFDPLGDYPSSPAQLKRLLTALEQEQPEHILLYAHGGLNSVKDAASRAGKWRSCFQRHGVFEIHFLWETGFLAELKDILIGKDKFANERAGASSSWWDNWIERLAQRPGYALWKEMKVDAERAFASKSSAGTVFLKALKESIDKQPNKPKLHLVGHSAGSIWHGHLLQQWRQLQMPALTSMSLFAPACTTALFQSHYQPLLGQLLPELDLYLLSDEDEQDDTVGGVYRKSLLYLVSRAFESRKEQVSILGMARFLDELGKPLPKSLRVYLTERDKKMTTASGHGGFDNDKPTMDAMLDRVLNKPRPKEGWFKPEELKGY
ncbi:C1 family peptidase [Permianibacter sp. IMCC34836]|uniref:C1 family peptidase n=1 Tax=Permianibacter fluminis TaxID=2738515 RepID=UPI001556F977|nr:C1 family peptidase [Permianibacter fluminis]NQD37719.1 C1 family peptidase [Permianibacter fluminis]